VVTVDNASADVSPHDNLVLVRPVFPRPGLVEVPPGYLVLSVVSRSHDELGQAYFNATGSGESWTTMEGAIEDISAAFAGEYGPTLPRSSLALTAGTDLAAVIFTVERATWGDVPDGPFVIDLFTDPAHRRRGLATWLLFEAIRCLPAVAPGCLLGLRVETKNHAALALYENLGFRILTEG
jgi:GNAT superfamily N-acetyltransferase